MASAPVPSTTTQTSISLINTTTPLTLPGSCHCGAITFLATLPHGFSPSACRRCTCTYCTCRGAIIVSVKDPLQYPNAPSRPSGIRFLDPSTGAPLPEEIGSDEVEGLSCYQFNTMTARHYFCSKCGINTHHQRRSDPESFGVSVACLEGVSVWDFERVDVIDGVRHSSDVGGKARMAGVLRFERAPAES